MNKICTGAERMKMKPARQDVKGIDRRKNVSKRRGVLFYKKASATGRL